MKSTTVRGTPYRKLDNLNGQGQRPQLPVGNKGTVDSHTAEPGIRTGPQGPGTPYNSEAGNGPETVRTVSKDKYGKVITNAAGNMNDPASNGDGVILDSVGKDYQDPRHEPLLDSPVAKGAAQFDTGLIVRDNRAHLGSGSGPTAPNDANARDDLLAIGGVMSRGMDSTSQTGQPEDELTKDDVFSTGGAGSKSDVQTAPRR